MNQESIDESYLLEHWFLVSLWWSTPDARFNELPADQGPWSQHLSVVATLFQSTAVHWELSSHWDRHESNDVDESRRPPSTCMSRFVVHAIGSQDPVFNVNTVRADWLDLYRYTVCRPRVSFVDPGRGAEGTEGARIPYPLRALAFLWAHGFTLCTVWVKKSPLRTCGDFSKTVGNSSTKFYTPAFLFTLDYEFLFNYLQLWRNYAILSVTTQFKSCAQNVHHRPKHTLAFSDIFPK